jgi:hypothetical protein
VIAKTSKNAEIHGRSMGGVSSQMTAPMRARSGSLYTLRELAPLLGVELGSLRKDVEIRGLTAAVPGRPGRHGAALYDIEEVRDFRQKGSAISSSPVTGPDPLEAVTRRAARIPDIIAGCARSVYAQSKNKNMSTAALLALLARQAAMDIWDELSDVLPALRSPDDSSAPGTIAEHNKISRPNGTITNSCYSRARSIGESAK